MSNKKVKWLEVGTVMESDGKDGKAKSLYIKVKNDVSLKKGQYLQVKKPQAEIDALLERGYIDEETANERKASIPAYVKLNIYLPPDRE